MVIRQYCTIKITKIVGNMRFRILLLLTTMKESIKKYGALKSRHKTLLLKSANFIIFNLFILSTLNAKVIMAVAQSQKPSQDDKRKGLKPQICFIIPEDVKKRINKDRMILVMDLDETMVYSRKKKPPKHSNYVTITINGTPTYVEFRPHIAEFLAAASELFTIYVYTAGSHTYADAVLNILPNHEVITKRFYRESCIQYKGELIKDLKVIRSTFDHEKQQKLTVLVDDNRISISYNHPHSVRIRAFEGNQEDTYLHHIFAKLLEYYRQHSPQAQS